ncbi:hypothetical protein PHLGIDRAFT_478831 [Phlebiopsis gigantea 11061_1 CR5-6]|uniref:Uncharacterized protein n=1 Tax=Phlebiopsis gigantea (strain 11061_1 CR5-6) TaxID=745531 RepID=A0A0C3RWL7_PHLG1|nr:hypothetical protein PHLGIDRAFT_478831 [Phlebiopsis gigantea 11061_1 CR5-6]
MLEVFSRSLAHRNNLNRARTAGCLICCVFITERLDLGPWYGNRMMTYNICNYKITAFMASDKGIHSKACASLLLSYRGAISFNLS